MPPSGCLEGVAPTSGKKCLCRDCRAAWRCRSRGPARCCPPCRRNNPRRCWRRTPAPPHPTRSRSGRTSPEIKRERRLRKARRLFQDMWHLLWVNDWNISVDQDGSARLHKHSRRPPRTNSSQAIFHKRTAARLLFSSEIANLNGKTTSLLIVPSPLEMQECYWFPGSFYFTPRGERVKWYLDGRIFRPTKSPSNVGQSKRDNQFHFVLSFVEICYEMLRATSLFMCYNSRSASVRF